MLKKFNSYPKGRNYLLTYWIYVITLVITMKTTETTIIRIGNSRGVRLKQDYLKKFGLKEGDVVEVSIKKATPNTKRAVEALRSIAAQNGPLSKIDVEKWGSTACGRL